MSSSLTHRDCRHRVCAVCLVSNKNKVIRNITPELETIFQTVFPQYERSKRFPCGLCVKCQVKMSKLKTGKVDEISGFTKYTECPINVQESSTTCQCFICKKVRQSALETPRIIVDSKGDSPTAAADPPKCSKCLSLIIPGGHKECSRSKLFENLMLQDPDVLEHVAAEVIRRKSSPEVTLNNHQGGKPLVVHVGSEGCKGETPMFYHSVHLELLSINEIKN